MTQNEFDAPDSIDPRTERALTEPLTVLDHDETPVESRETTVVTVTSHSGKTYDVDAASGACSCPDARHREPEGGCKHVRRARVALGREPVAARTIRALEVDPQLGANAPGPRVATSDGGIIDAGDDGEIIDDDDGRPEGCDCADFHDDAALPCFECYREGFDQPASSSE
jgi:predicted nucleic acid-binding Zn finger protein